MIYRRRVNDTPRHGATRRDTLATRSRRGATRPRHGATRSRHGATSLRHPRGMAQHLCDTPRHHRDTSQQHDLAHTLSNPVAHSSAGCACSPGHSVMCDTCIELSTPIEPHVPHTSHQITSLSPGRVLCTARLSDLIVHRMIAPAASTRSLVRLRGSWPERQGAEWPSGEGLSGPVG